MATKFAPLRAEVERAAIEAACAHGMEFRRAAILRKFAGRGVSSRSISRWISRVVDDGHAGRAVAGDIRAAARRATATRNSAQALRERVAKLPRRQRSDEGLASPANAASYLAMCVHNALAVAESAMSPGGGAKNARLLRQAMALLRRCCGTATRLAEARVDADQLQQFHTVVLSTLEHVSSELREMAAAELRRAK